MDWYYLDGEEEQRGPMGFEELVQALAGIPDPRSVYVWNEEMADWMEAGAVPEVSERLPPVPAPPPVAPPRALPQTPLEPVLDQQWFALSQDAETIARLYRRLVLLIGFQFFLSFLFSLLGAGVSETVLGVLALMFLPAIGILWFASLWTIYQLASQLGSNPAILWVVFMFVPLGNLIALGVLSAKATAWCRRHGIKVGLLGPTLESIRELRQRINTSVFA